jgi:hypothetical protein
LRTILHPLNLLVLHLPLKRSLYFHPVPHKSTLGPIPMSSNDKSDASLLGPPGDKDVDAPNQVSRNVDRPHAFSLTPSLQQNTRAPSQPRSGLTRSSTLQTARYRPYQTHHIERTTHANTVARSPEPTIPPSRVPPVVAQTNEPSVGDSEEMNDANMRNLGGDKEGMTLVSDFYRSHILYAR